MPSDEITTMHSHKCTNMCKYTIYSKTGEFMSSPCMCDLGPHGNVHDLRMYLCMHACMPYVTFSLISSFSLALTN